MINFIKLNDPECLRKLIEFLLRLPPRKKPKYQYLDSKYIWVVIVSHNENSIFMKFKIEKTKKFPNVDKTNRMIQKLRNIHIK